MWVFGFDNIWSQPLCVKIPLSQPQTINSGMTQGSSLGSLLFLININDLSIFIRRINTCYMPGKNSVDIENTLSDSRTSASDWCLKKWHDSPVTHTSCPAISKLYLSMSTSMVLLFQIWQQQKYLYFTLIILWVRVNTFKLVVIRLQKRPWSSSRTKMYLIIIIIHF